MLKTKPMGLSFISVLNEMVLASSNHSFAYKNEASQKMQSVNAMSTEKVCF